MYWYRGWYVSGAGIASRPASRMNIKYISLTLLTLQNALLILVMRYTRTRDGEMYFTTTVVILSEVVKLFTCLFVIFWQEGRNLSQCMTVGLPYSFSYQMIKLSAVCLSHLTGKMSVHSQKAVTAYFSSKQLLPFDVAVKGFQVAIEVLSQQTQHFEPMLV